MCHLTLSPTMLLKFRVDHIEIPAMGVIVWRSYHEGDRSDPYHERYHSNLITGIIIVILELHRYKYTVVGAMELKKLVARV